MITGKKAIKWFKRYDATQERSFADEIDWTAPVEITVGYVIMVKHTMSASDLRPTSYIFVPPGLPIEDALTDPTLIKRCRDRTLPFPKSVA